MKAPNSELNDTGKRILLVIKIRSKTTQNSSKQFKMQLIKYREIKASDVIVSALMIRFYQQYQK